MRGFVLRNSIFIFNCDSSKIDQSHARIQNRKIGRLPLQSIRAMLLWNSKNQLLPHLMCDGRLAGSPQIRVNWCVFDHAILFSLNARQTINAMKASPIIVPLPAVTIVQAGLVAALFCLFALLLTATRIGRRAAGLPPGKNQTV